MSWIWADCASRAMPEKVTSLIVPVPPKYYTRQSRKIGGMLRFGAYRAVLEIALWQRVQP